MGKGDDVRAADDEGAAILDCFRCARPSDNVDSHGREHPLSPKSPMSLPASMELSPKSSMSLPAAMELEIVTETATTAELLERGTAQSDAEAPGARLIGDVQGSGAALNTFLRQLAIGTAMACILGTLWALKAQTVTVIDLLAEHVHSAGAWGVAGFMATFVVYGVLLLPLSPIELLAGFLFPFWTALAVCVAGKVTSSALCFIIGRTVGAGFARRMLARHPSLKSLGDAVASRPFTTTLLLRLAYIPAGVKNYGLSLTAVRLPVFLPGRMWSTHPPQRGPAMR